MATVTKPSTLVRIACREALAHIMETRNLQVKQLVQAQMCRKRFSFRKLKIVPKFKCEAEALEYLKNDDRDFFGSEYSFATGYGWQREENIKKLLSMANKSASITLSTEDHNLIGSYL